MQLAENVAEFIITSELSKGKTTLEIAEVLEDANKLLKFL